MTRSLVITSDSVGGMLAKVIRPRSSSVEAGEDRQHGPLGGIEAGVGMERAIEAQEAGVGGIGVGKHRPLAGDEVVQRPAVQLAGVVAVVVVLEHDLPVPGELAGHGGRRPRRRRGRSWRSPRPRRQARRERRGGAVEIDEDEALPDLHLERRQGGPTSCRNRRCAPWPARSPDRRPANRPSGDTGRRSRACCRRLRPPAWRGAGRPPTWP